MLTADDNRQSDLTLWLDKLSYIGYTEQADDGASERPAPPTGRCAFGFREMLSPAQSSIGPRRPRGRGLSLS